MPAIETNKFEDVQDLMTEEELNALKEVTEDGFEDTALEDAFEPEELRLARLEEIERERVEEEEKDVDFTTEEDEEAAAKEAEMAAAKEADDKARDGEGDEGEGEDADAEEVEAKEEVKPAPAAPAPDVIKAAMEATDQAIEARIAELTQKLDDVEISSEEFKAGIKEANAARRDMIESNIANISFQQATKSYLAQYPDLATPSHIDGLNAEFEAIDNSPIFGSLSDSEKLALAHDRYNNSIEVAKARGLTVPDAVPIKGKAKAMAATAEIQPEDKKPEAAKPAKPAVPKTLAKIPASDPASAAEGSSQALRKFMESEDPDALEDALMTKISIKDLENM